MEEWGLVPVAQVDSFHGFIFGTFDPEAPSLLDYLGDMAWYMDTMFNWNESGTEVVGGVHKWVIPCNWKFAADNFQGDSYHFPLTHISAIKVGFGGGAARRAEQDTNRGRGTGTSVYPGFGHGTTVQPAPPRAGDPAVNDYLQSTFPHVQERLGEVKAGRAWNIHGGIFPNFSYLGAHSHPTVRVWHPRGPDKIEVWSWGFRDKAAPEDAKEAWRLDLIWTFCMSGVFEQDDGENWDQCTVSSSGTVGRRYPFNFRLGIGHERRDEELPGLISSSPSETNQIGFYDFWADLMSSERWADVLSKHNNRSDTQSRHSTI
jgi:3-phenylpropionate/trans-cinnamate dioxygenase alpha subunit